MKLTHLLTLSLGLTLGWSAAAASTPDDFTGTAWARGVSQSSGWYDANKNLIPEDADDYLCYAASAANLIAWWQDGDRAVANEAPAKHEDIWQTFVRNNQTWDEGGNTLSAINWWVSGVYSPVIKNDTTGDWDWEDDENPVWDRFYAKPEESYVTNDDGSKSESLSMSLPNYKQKDTDSGEYKYFGGYYYDRYGLTQQNLSDFLSEVWSYEDPDTAEQSSGTIHTMTLGNIDAAAEGEGAEGEEESIDWIYDVDFITILADSPISLAIYSETPYPGTTESLAHAITLWGVEYDNGELVKIWLTDSDDANKRTAENGLFSLSVFMDKEQNRIYLDDNPEDNDIFCSEYGNDVYIRALYAIDTSEAANWQLVPEPATATLSLLALTALAARRRRTLR